MYTIYKKYINCFFNRHQAYMWRVMAEWSSAPDSSSGVSDKQSVGSSPGLDTCVLNQGT